MLPIVLLIRHGETARNKSPERIRGWDDIPLTAKGRSEAKDMASNICTYEVSHVLSSPLSRAVFTGKTIAKQCDVKFSTDHALKPWNLGDLQGKPVSSVLSKLNLFIEHPDKPVPGGESFDTFKKRFLTRLEAAMSEAKHSPDQGAVVLVCHTRNLMLARSWLSAGATSNFEVDLKVLQDYDSQKSTGEGYQLTYKANKWSEKEIKGGVGNAGS